MDNPADNASLKSQYADQIAADLERNSAEHERLSSEIASMRQQLTVLETNRALLLSMQQTVSGEAQDGLPSSDGEGSAAPEGPVAGEEKPKVAKTAGSRPERVREAGVPTLRNLVSDTLVRHGGPRSAAEVTAALAQAHPDRTIKVTVVRSTLESLVAKGQVRRSKQKKSVFYSADASEVSKVSAGTEENTETRGGVHH